MHTGIPTRCSCLLPTWGGSKAAAQLFSEGVHSREMPSQGDIEKERRKALASRASKRPKLEEHGGTVESWTRFVATHSELGMGGPCAAASFEFIEVKNIRKPTWLSLAAWQEDWVVAPGTCIFTSKQMRSQAATLLEAGLRETKGLLLACDFSYKVTIAGHCLPNKF